METPKNYLIGIHSYKRGNWLLKYVNSLSLMSENIISNTKVFIRREDFDNYLGVMGKFGVNLECVDVPKESYLALTRDIMLDYAIRNNYTHYIMLDDDIRFAIRPHLNGEYRTSTKEIFEKMIEEVISICNDEYPITGIVARQFSNNFDTLYRENQRIIQLMCIHIPTISKDRVYFNAINLSCMSDYYFVLSYLKKGYKNKVITMYTRDDKMQTEGGCSVYRTTEMVSASAIKLYKAFPDCVTLAYKNTGTWKENRIDVRMQWKKAFNKEKYEERKLKK